jgi:hypothetical protein
MSSSVHAKVTLILVIDVLTIHSTILSGMPLINSPVHVNNSTSAHAMAEMTITSVLYWNAKAAVVQLPTHHLNKQNSNRPPKWRENF